MDGRKETRDDDEEEENKQNCTHLMVTKKWPT